MEMEGREGGREGGVEEEEAPPPPPSRVVSSSPPLKNLKHRMERSDSDENEGEGGREGGHVAASSSGLR